MLIETGMCPRMTTVQVPFLQTTETQLRTRAAAIAVPPLSPHEHFVDASWLGSESVTPPPCQEVDLVPPGEAPGPVLSSPPAWGLQRRSSATRLPKYWQGPCLSTTGLF